MGKLPLSDTVNKIVIFFIYFFLFTLAGIALSSILMIPFRTEGNGISVAGLRVIQTVQTIMMFVLPVIFFIKRLGVNFWQWLGLDKKMTFSEIIISFISILSLIPISDLVYKFNKSIKFPDFMKPLEDWFWEQHNADGVGMLIGFDGIGNIAISLFIVGIVAAVSEELFFRGTFQKILYGEKPTSGQAVKSILLTSLFFSALHIDFFGFLPRLLVGGIYFGFLYWWTGKLGITIWCHFLNNTIAYFTRMYFELNGIDQQVADNYEFPLYVDLLATVLFIVSGGWFYYNYKKRLSAESALPIK